MSFLRSNYYAGLILSIAATSLIGCGSGGSLAGVEGTGGSQQGDVTGFSSIVVNGEAVNVDQAEIIVNGEAASEADVKVGHIVVIETGSDGRAQRVVADRHLDGPLESVDFAAGTAESLSQPIRVTATTRFENTSFSTEDSSPRGVLNPNDRDLIAVNGFIDADGVLVATLFRRNTSSYVRDSSVFDLNGTVSQLDNTNLQFMIGQLRVSFTNANVDGSLENGASVEIFGMQAQPNGVFEASQVTVLQDASSVVGTNATLSGFVTEAIGDSRFVVDGITVNAENATRGDNSLAVVSRNAFVRVAGRYATSSTILADRFTLVPASGISYTATATVSDSRIAVYGITVLSSAGTIFQDKSALALRTFSASDIVNGDKLNISGYYDRDQQFTATVIERLNGESADTVRGTITNCSPLSNQLEIADLTVNLSNQTTYFNQQGEQFASRSDFCAAANGHTGTASGTASGNTLNADRIQLSR